MPDTHDTPQCSFCDKTAGQFGVAIISAKTQGVYICDECAIMTVFGPVMEMRGGKIDFVLPTGDKTHLQSFGDNCLGAEYCPKCRTYSVELGTPVKSTCINCGSIFPAREMVKYEDLDLE